MIKNSTQFKLFDCLNKTIEQFKPVEKEDVEFFYEIYLNKVNGRKIIGADKRYHQNFCNDILWMEQNVLSKEYLKKSGHPDIYKPPCDCGFCGGGGCSRCR